MPFLRQTAVADCLTKQPTFEIVQWATRASGVDDQEVDLRTAARLIAPACARTRGRRLDAWSALTPSCSRRPLPCRSVAVLR